jgi:hypothetical protein
MTKSALILGPISVPMEIFSRIWEQLSALAHHRLVFYACEWGRALAPRLALAAESEIVIESVSQAPAASAGNIAGRAGKETHWPRRNQHSAWKLASIFFSLASTQRKSDARARTTPRWMCATCKNKWREEELGACNDDCVTAVDPKPLLFVSSLLFFPLEVVVQVHGSEEAPSELLYTCCWLEIWMNDFPFSPW